MTWCGYTDWLWFLKNLGEYWRFAMGWNGGESCSVVREKDKGEWMD